MAVKKRDVVLMGKTASGDKTIEMPITRLGNIEDDAEIKARPAAGDHIPIMDMEDGGQMKKFLYTPSEGSGGSESPSGESTHRFYQKKLTFTNFKTNSNVTFTVNADIYDIVKDGVKHKAANGVIYLNSCMIWESEDDYSPICWAPSEYPPTPQNTVHTAALYFGTGTTPKLFQLYVCFSEITDDDVPFFIPRIGLTYVSDQGNFSGLVHQNSFFFVEGV